MKYNDNEELLSYLCPTVNQKRKYRKKWGVIILDSTTIV